MRGPLGIVSARRKSLLFLQLPSGRHLRALRQAGRNLFERSQRLLLHRTQNQRIHEQEQKRDADIAQGADPRQQQLQPAVPLAGRRRNLNGSGLERKIFYGQQISALVIHADGRTRQLLDRGHFVGAAFAPGAGGLTIFELGVDGIVDQHRRRQAPHPPSRLQYMADVLTDGKRSAVGLRRLAVERGENIGVAGAGSGHVGRCAWNSGRRGAAALLFGMLLGQSGGRLGIVNFRRVLGGA